MITPGFFGFFNAQRALITAQNALSTINHNIANVNTPGYSRQRVEISAFDAYQAPGYQALMGGQIGQGSVVDKVIRIRDSFLDAQYTQENSTLGYNLVKKEVLSQMEGILNEPSDSGINTALSRFFDAAQALSLHPESIPVRQDFIQAAADFSTVVNQTANQLLDLRTNLVGINTQPTTLATSQAALTVAQINEKLATIASLNKQIITVNASGAQPNDLLDQRDKMLDELSELVDIQIVPRERGLVDVIVGTNNGITAVRGGDLVETFEYRANPGGVGLNSATNKPGVVYTVNAVPPTTLNFGTPRITGGRLAAILEMGAGDYGVAAGFQLNYDNPRTLLQDLSNFMDQFTQQVNAVQIAGFDINGNSAAGTRIFLPAVPAAFMGDIANSALSYSVNPLLFAANGPDLVAAADVAGSGPGDGRNALQLAQLRDANIPLLGGLSFNEFLNGRISQVGIQSRTFQDRSTSQQNVVNALDQRRQSVSGVNLDEETIDLVRFQRAFEASSRVIRSLDEIVQTIINMV